MALAVVAIDAFRMVNETLGHQTGDAVLVEVAARLASLARGGDLVARIGGDMFGILMPQVAHRQDAEARLNAYVEAFREPFGTGDREGKDLPLTASIGVALASLDATSFEELLAYADVAAYEAKQGGRARHTFFSRQVQANFQSARRLKEELTLAIERNEFELYFQPHVEMTSGRVAGAEALIRWNHPERGLVAPMEFIPFAERHGFAEQIGTWVMRETIRISAPWRHADPTVTIWFNMAQSELQCSSLAARLDELQPGLHGVGVEITEETVMENAHELAAAIGMLRDAGFCIALDDFGTGYSSLAHVRHLPVDVIKIDRSFINGIPGDRHDITIVSAVLSIAEQYGYSTVAEGVETMEQVAFLAAGGCTYGQGYLYARPMPATAFERWMRERRAA